jgi:type II secretory pathway pseudopilin PulG
MLGILTPTLIKIILVLALFSGVSMYAVHWHNSTVDKAVIATRNTILVEQQKQTIKLLDRQQEVNLSLQEAIDERNKKYAKDVASLNDKYYAAITGLRDRPTRTLGTNQSINYTSTSDRETSKGCYPIQLYREDAELAINYSRDAEQVRIALLSCYDKYDEVKTKIELLNKQK